jgi:hypothetical protein
VLIDEIVRLEAGVGESRAFNPADFVDDVARIRAAASERYGPGEGIVNMAGGAERGPLQLTGPTQGEINAVRGNRFHQDVYESLRQPENTAKVTGNVRGAAVNTEPDLLGLRTGVTDIKDEIRISFDKQLRAEYDYAGQTGQTFNLVISPRTQIITQPLQQAIRQSGGIIVEFDSLSGSFRSVRLIGNRVQR